ncbi:hypothetical protein OHS70_04830 [Streptomyces sp. NBC_00390]
MHADPEVYAALTTDSGENYDGPEDDAEAGGVRATQTATPKR